MSADNEKDGDCAIKLMRMARTKWQKATAEYLVEKEKKDNAFFAEIKTNLKWVKWLVTCIGGVTLISLFGLLLQRAMVAI